MHATQAKEGRKLNGTAKSDYDENTYFFYFFLISSFFWAFYLPAEMME